MVPYGTIKCYQTELNWFEYMLSTISSIHRISDLNQQKNLSKTEMRLPKLKHQTSLQGFPWELPPTTTIWWRICKQKHWSLVLEEILSNKMNSGMHSTLQSSFTWNNFQNLYFLSSPSALTGIMGITLCLLLLPPPFIHMSWAVMSAKYKPVTQSILCPTFLMHVRTIKSLN